MAGAVYPSCFHNRRTPHIYLVFLPYQAGHCNPTRIGSLRLANPGFRVLSSARRLIR